MTKRTVCLCAAAFTVACLCSIARADSDGDGTKLSTLYKFQAPDTDTYTSAYGSQPDTRPVFGSGDTIYGMTEDGGPNGTGVIYRFDLRSRTYTVLHTFGPLDGNGTNMDGAYPGVALTRGPNDVFYGVASYGGPEGSGTVFKITASGEFTVLYAFSAPDANGNNEDGSNPLRTVVVGHGGNLYGTTRVGGKNTCLFTGGCGVAWVIDASGFRVLHQFTASEGHAASLIQARDGEFYGCAVWPATSLPLGPLPSGVLYRMSPSGQNFQILHRFSQTDANGVNADGADCYEPLLETSAGVFYGTASNGGRNATGVVFRYSIWNTGKVETVHSFGALNATGQNWDGAYPYARLTRGEDGALYATASYGGANGNGVVYRIRSNGEFAVLHTFTATDPTTGANVDGAIPDYGVLAHGNKLIGIANFGGNGGTAGLLGSGGTLYELRLDDDDRDR